MRSTQGFSTRIVSRVHNYNTGEERRGEERRVKEETQRRQRGRGY